MMNSLADVLIKGDGIFRLWKNVYIVGEETQISGHSFGNIMKSTRLDFMEDLRKEKYSEGGLVPPTEVNIEKEMEIASKEGNVDRYKELRELQMIKQNSGHVKVERTTVGGMSITEETWVPKPPIQLKDLPTEDLLDELIRRAEEKEEEPTV